MSRTKQTQPRSQRNGYAFRYHDDSGGLLVGKELWLTNYEILWLGPRLVLYLAAVSSFSTQSSSPSSSPSW